MHRHRVRVLPRRVGVHLEEVPVALLDDMPAAAAPALRRAAAAARSGRACSREDDDARDGHRPREPGVHTRQAAPAVRPVGAAGAHDQQHGAPDVEHEARQQHDAQDPQQALVRQQRHQHLAQPVRVVVELVWALEDVEVAVHVHEHERGEDQARDGHHHLRSEVRHGHPMSPRRPGPILNRRRPSPPDAGPPPKRHSMGTASANGRPCRPGSAGRIRRGRASRARPGCGRERGRGRRRRRTAGAR